MWYYGGYDGDCPSPSGSTNMDEFGMPATPGCIEGSLKLSGNTDKPYKLNGTQIIIENLAVVDSTDVIYATAVKDEENKIKGPARPDNSLDAKTFQFTTLKNVVMTSATRFTVNYQQDFNYIGTTDDLEAYGARVAVYHAAWVVTVHSKTYEYEIPKLVITYEGDVPPTTDITGDFDILPSSTINWRDSFSLKPKNFSFSTGCTYQYHQYQIERNGQIWTSDTITGGTSTTTPFSYSSYPYNIAVGSHYITIKVVADCGDSGWTGGKTLNVNGPPTNNPPEFSVGWTQPNMWTQAGVQTKVVVGTQLDLVYLDDPAPSDPDGDGFEFLGFDFTSQAQWARDIPSKYGASMNGYQRITMDTAGSYCAKGTMRDSFGASTTNTACIQVVEPNPIPVISAPSVIRENHPVSPAINGDLSYSPVGRPIDHSKDFWVNRQSVYTTPGEVTLSLEVYDNKGLQSLSPAIKVIDVLPDEPPVAALNVQPLGLRTTPYDIFNNSYTTDGDKIVSAAYRYRYDDKNNGFSDDAWQSMTGSLTKTTITPSKVGKYEIEVTVTEDYGKTDTTSVVLDTVNLAPAVSFLLEGENETPAPNNKKKYAAADILKNWTLFQTNTTTVISKAPGWSSSGNTLSVGLGKLGDKIRSYFKSYDSWGASRTDTNISPITDGGNGYNSLSSYRAIQSGSVVVEPLMKPTSINGNMKQWDYAYTYYEGAGSYTQPQGFYFKSNKSHLYFTSPYYRGSGEDPGDSLLALNLSKIGNFSAGFSCDDAACSTVSFKRAYANDQHPYDFIIDPEDLNQSRPKLKVGRWKSVADYQTGDLSKATSVTEQTLSQSKVLGYQVADQTIYQIVKWTCPQCTYIQSSGGYRDEVVIDIRTYDPFTGVLINSTAMNGENYANRIKSRGFMNKGRMFTRGDNMIYLEDKTFIEIDRSGNAEVKLTLPYEYVPDIFRGPDGEWYFYYVSSTIDNADYDNETYVVQVKADYTIGWTVKLKGQSPTPDIALAGQVDRSDNNHLFYINPIKREIIARSYSRHGSDFGMDTFYEVINMDTHAKRDYGGFNFTSISTSMSIDWLGNYLQSQAQYTADGFRTERSGNTFKVYSGNTVVNAFTAPVNTMDANTFFATSADAVMGGSYVADGVYLAFYNISSYGNPRSTSLAPYLIKGTPTDNAMPYLGYKRGQFVSTETLDNAEMTWTMNMANPTIDTELSGMSFRMTDPRNRYAVESNGTSLFVSKYVNGVRTVLQSTSFAMQADTNYSFKVGMEGSRIQVYVNDVPYFDVTDTQFSSGKFGPFSDKPYVDFANIAQVQLAAPTVEWVTNYAIWDDSSATADVRVSNLVFTDPENDPRAGNYRWYIEHTPKFLNNQGLSALNGRTLTSPAALFDKVGNYRVTLRAQDDPNLSYPFPQTEFGSYRKFSNEYWQILTVHRRPIAQFTLSFAADKSLIWKDTSYDPDRWVNATTYSAEATGIDYQATRGVLERRYYYKTPSGATFNAKLVTPTETGTYTVGLQVKDEYGAWSYWAEKEIQIDTPVIPDSPPTPGFILSRTTLYRGEALTITSTAFDAEDGTAANLNHEYYIRNTTLGTGETYQSGSRGQWTKVFNSVGVMAIRQVVCDSKDQCATLTKNVSVINRAPLANFDWSPKPAWEGDAITLTNSSSDPDGDGLTYTWSITGPGGYSVTTSSQQAAISGSKVKPGMFTVRLTVNDGTSSDTIARNITVNALGVHGEVKHTSTWDSNRLAWNNAHPDNSRGPDVFWAGEAFVLEAVATNTGTSSTKASTVTVQAFGGESKELAAGDASNTTWSALWSSADTDIEFAQLTDGFYTFVFTATYTNGVVKTDSATIRIEGSVDGYVRVHRLR